MRQLVGCRSGQYGATLEGHLDADVACGRRDANSGGAGLVLSGGGARGAYAMGALSVLLPRLKDEVRIVVGTSVGALTSVYLAANWHRRAEDIVRQGCGLWQEISYGDVLAPLVSRSSALRLLRSMTDLSVRRLQASSVLDPEPLERTLARVLDFNRVHANLRDGQLDALGIALTSAYTNRSFVFHCGGRPHGAEDQLRGIEYVDTPRLGTKHVLASTAIPALFPAIRVEHPVDRAGWYYDGAPRLNAPIKPALWLGADRVIVIATNHVGGSGMTPPQRRPDIVSGFSQLLQSALADSLTQDIRTLAHRNMLVGQSHADGGEVVPYIFIAPEDPAAIGALAQRLYRKNHSGLRGLASVRDLSLLGQLISAGTDSLHAELLSYLFFAREFADELLALGRLDAQRWLEEHPADPWRVEPLGAWTDRPGASRPPEPLARAKPRTARDRDTLSQVGQSAGFRAGV